MTEDPNSRWPLDWPKSKRPAAARVVGNLFRSRNVIWENDHKVVAQFGLTWSQFQTLMALRSAGPDFVLAPTQLYDAAQVSSGGLTKMLHGLSDQGHVERLDNPQDKRSKLVRLTPAGADVVERAVHALMDTNKALIGSILDAQEFEQLAQLLEKLNAGLGAGSGKAGKGPG